MQSVDCIYSSWFLSELDTVIRGVLLDLRLGSAWPCNELACACESNWREVVLFVSWLSNNYVFGASWIIDFPPVGLSVFQPYIMFSKFIWVSKLSQKYTKWFPYKIQIINSSWKIFPPLPGANKCQYNKQYVTQKINQGGYTNSTLPTGISHFLHTRAYTKESTLMWYSL
jgi:hypothetical protein